MRNDYGIRPRTKMLRGGGIAQRGKGVALRGGGIAQRGVGQALKKGGMAKKGKNIVTGNKAKPGISYRNEQGKS